MRTLATLFACAVLFPSFSFACDICSIYRSLDSQRPIAETFRLGAGQQFSEFGDLRTEGRKIANPLDQKLRSSITQLIGEYDFSDTTGLQLVVPYINRRYRRVAEEGTSSGVEAGMGDTTLLGHFIPYELRTSDYAVVLQLSAGVKLPTGSSRRLREEHAGESVIHSKHAGTEHGIDYDEATPQSVVHGHDLALGSGSFDFPLGVNLLAQSGRMIFLSNVQYTVRTQGDYSYEYADDLTFEAGPGYYISSDVRRSLAVKLNVSGEYKGHDRGAGGREEEGTKIRTIFFGPAVLANLWDRVSLDLGIGWPVSVSSSGTQATVSLRVRGGVTVRF